ncbi:MAG: hydratase [Oscillospiraceae bacterium]|jgi:aconitate hydratase|nr:hydratase [Oscillospiraceae bacterium]
MSELIRQSVIIKNGAPVPQSGAADRGKTLAYGILAAHNTDSSGKTFRLKFDALVSHDITYVGIIQTARASGLTEFPVPYALTNCHNSLCAVGGTINADDHAFGLSAAKKYGGIYVPANLAVIHQYAREEMTAVGRMILGSDSHTRYGSFGTMGFGEGGGELAKQLLKNTYDIAPPEVVLVWLTGAPQRGVGPQDVALELIRDVFPDGFVKNKILEFAGPGVAGLSAGFRAGIDVMTTETSCLSSIWETDAETERFYKAVGRPGDYTKLAVAEGTQYDAAVILDMSRTECMIALPFHPSKAYTINELQKNARAIFEQVQEECNTEIRGATADLTRHIGVDGGIYVQQGVIAGCSGGIFGNLCETADILFCGAGEGIGQGDFELSIYPASQPVNAAILKNGLCDTFLNAGAVVKPAFCGPCFGAGDTPANNALSIRHATRNFASREGSKTGSGQISLVALMDARSIAATAINGGRLTAATDIDYTVTPREFTYDRRSYDARVYNGFGRADDQAELVFGPNIADWPHFPALADNVEAVIAAVIHDDVTTTDELIPSGETSSYRSNPVALSEFTLSRRVPEYVSRAKTAGLSSDGKTVRGSGIYARKPGDGSAREQAASCQRVLGGTINIAVEYATKRYRSNLINWGILPFTLAPGQDFTYEPGDIVVIEGIRDGLTRGLSDYTASVLRTGRQIGELKLRLDGLNDTERQILLDGCLINYYAAKNA